MLDLESARDQIFSEIKPLPKEEVPVNSAYGRVLSEAITAGLNLPAFDNSAMDGYAVRAQDVASASAKYPVTLQVSGRVEAGASPQETVQPGTCLRLFTGSVLPQGADAVVMQENTRTEPAKPGFIQVLAKVSMGEHVRCHGEDVRRGEQVLGAGVCLGAGSMGLLAALGVRMVSVSRQPVVAVLATGSELREPGQPLSANAIYESNRTLLAPGIARAGAILKIFPLVPDTLAATASALEKAMEQCDVVVTTGGVSVGELDFVKSAWEQLGGQMGFWKVAIKPGKPFVFGNLGGKFLFGLPGNPVSAWVTFLLLVWPALKRLQGAAHCQLPIHPGMLVERMVNHGDRRHFMRVSVNEVGEVRGSGMQASHALSSLAKANGLVDVAPGASLPPGTMVKVLRWDI